MKGSGVQEMNWKIAPSCWAQQWVQQPAEISEPHLREDMDLEAPMPLTSELQAEGMAINKPH